VFWMKVIVNVAVKVFRAVKPRASANEDTAGKPLRSVVAVGGTVVRSNIVVSVWTFRCSSDVDAHLGLCFGSCYREADSSNNG
jgi:hypothetical protein